MARQCSCGGTIRQHQLTRDREAWTCNACERYEIFDFAESRGTLKASDVAVGVHDQNRQCFAGQNGGK